jgi:hypothetical protein
MLPGSTIIKKCSECAHLIEEFTIMSGNTFGATFWTDGKRDAPMLPDQLWFIKCPHCQALLWVDEQEKVGEVDPFSDDETFKEAQSYSEPALHDYFFELHKNGLDKKKERYLRIRAWWSGNDKRRDTKTVKQNLSDEEIENIQALYFMLDSSDENDRIMMAEIMREMGQFENAEMILEKPFTDELSEEVSIIGELIQKREPFVAKINFEN